MYCTHGVYQYGIAVYIYHQIRVEVINEYCTHVKLSIDFDSCYQYQYIAILVFTFYIARKTKYIM